jgi:hypothetical protein
VDDPAYAKALAKELQSLVCTYDSNAIYILRGAIEFGRLAATDREAPAAVDFIMSKDCSISTSLTNEDKLKLLKIRQDVGQKFPPFPAPNNKK